MLATPVPFRELDALRSAQSKKQKSWQRGGPPPNDARLEYTALHQSVYNCRLNQVKLLVAKCSANVNSRDRLGRTPLILCCKEENETIALKMTRIFLRAGAQLGIKDIKGRNVLAHACIYGRQKMVLEMLNEEAADLSDPDNDGNTPLHHAAVQGNPIIVQALVREMKLYSASGDPRNVLGYTPLMLAAKHGNWHAAVIILVHAGASGFLRENEHFRNALDWIKVADMNQRRRPRRQQTAPSSAPPAFLTQRSATTLGLTGNFYDELVREVSFAYGLPDPHRCGGLPQLPPSANTLISQVPNREAFVNKFGGVKQDDQLTVDYVPLNAVEEDEDEHLDILQLNYEEARTLLLERLERQECAPGGRSFARPSLGRAQNLSRPQTSVLRASAPPTRNSAAENLRYLLNMVHGQGETLKSAQLIREETGFVEGVHGKSSTDLGRGPSAGKSGNAKAPGSAGKAEKNKK